MAMTALGNAVTPVAALVTLPILSYTLGVTGRGEIAAATAPLLLAVTAATFGIPEAVAYLVAEPG
jgi:O-antigen/teichoic acid export membrane protein